jgi:MFS family permease
MSIDDGAMEQQKRKGLRVAFAVSAGFTVAVYYGAVIPFLGPLFAVQFLLASAHPTPFGKAVGLAILIVVVGIAMMALTSMLGDQPGPFLLILGLIYFLCFVVQSTGSGNAATYLILVVSILVPMLAILNKDLANSILSILVSGVLSGTILMWLAHALFPEPPSEDTEVSSPSQRSPNLFRALANTAILLGSVMICLTSSNLTAAAVIPITVASLLGQIDFAAGAKAAMGLILVNLFGGVLAVVSYSILMLRPGLITMYIIVLLVGLFLGGRAAGRSHEAPVFAGALTVFLILFGLGVSPLPGSAAETFASRITYVLATMAYTLLLSLLMWPKVKSRKKSVQDLHP